MKNQKIPPILLNRSKSSNQSFFKGVVIMLVLGLLTSPLNWQEHPLQLSFQLLTASFFIFSFFLFFKKEGQYLINLLIGSGTTYIYTLFWIYPGTPSMFSLICIVPIFAIVLFNQRIFYHLAISNLIIGPVSIIFISVCPYLSKQYTYLTQDIWGAILNFICIQIIIYFVFLLTLSQMRKINEYQEEIERSKQLNSISHLAASIAHEIRNPITVVKGFSQLLHTSSSITEEEKSYLETILKELDYTQLIISDYLSLSKPIHPYEIKQLSLNHEIKAITDLMSTFANSKNIGFIINEQQNIHVKMNAIELKQVILNLVKNAIESMQKPGYIMINLEESNNQVIIEIIDEGVGMPKEVIEKIGTPFYTLKERGTGIGLTICYNIVDKYQGKIEVESVHQKGTTFRISLPRSEK